MPPSAAPDLSKHHRFPGEIISHAVWLYCRFPLVIATWKSSCLHGDRRLLRSDPEVVPAIWPSLCQYLAAAPAAPWRHVASG
jgi:hypothetical protein